MAMRAESIFFAQDQLLLKKLGNSNKFVWKSPALFNEIEFTAEFWEEYHINTIAPAEGLKQ